ncbi:hypothetical protein CNY89_28885, partial [Amaricoccus sp. HAR-UPW-R2A-40]
ERVSLADIRAAADMGYRVKLLGVARMTAQGLAALAFGTRVDFEGVAIEGIERVSLADIRAAADMGYRVKLLGVARMTAQGLA